MKNGNSRLNESELLVVGIGASAGGLRALEDFFWAMPSNCGADKGLKIWGSVCATGFEHHRTIARRKPNSNKVSQVFEIEYHIKSANSTWRYFYSPADHEATCEEKESSLKATVCSDLESSNHDHLSHKDKLPLWLREEGCHEPPCRVKTKGGNILEVSVSAVPRKRNRARSPTC